MPEIKVSIDQIQVIKDGDPSGEGELYWLFRANNTTISERRHDSATKVSSGENIVIDKSRTLSLNDNDTFTVYLSVSDKDGGFDGADETDSTARTYSAADNWGDGLIEETLSSGPIHVKVFGRIDLIAA